MQRRNLRFPFVVTFTATATATAACGGLAIVDADGHGTGAGGGTTGTSTTGATTATATASSSGGNITCPATAPSGYVSCEASPGVCSYPVSCQSGTVTLSFTCAEGWWELEPSPCAQPYDSCPGTEYYCDGSWWMPTGTNPPSPCPEKPPPAGEPCVAGGMGGVWEHCGYHCTLGDPSSGWTVATCNNPNGEGVWTYDGTCGG